MAAMRWWASPSSLPCWPRSGGPAELRRSYPDYFISKNKIELKPGMDVQALVDAMQQRYAAQPHSTVDGLRIEFGKDLGAPAPQQHRAHHPRVCRAPSMAEADELAQRFVKELGEG
jgi:phosphomannomutase